jgi:flagellar hook-associated protein 2
MSSTAGAISGSIKWTGLASGTDFGSVVEQLVAIERRTITRQETWKAEWQEKITAISGLNTRLVSLKLDAQDKDIRSELLSRSASLSDDKIVSIQNTSTASLGSYDITVAESVVDKFASRGFDTAGIIDIDSGATGTTVEITVGDPLAGGAVYTLTAAAYSGTAAAGVLRMGAGSSLTTLLEDINATVAADAQQLITATLINDKDLGGGVFTKRLQLTSVNSGSANRITVEDTVTNLQLGKTYVDDPVYTTFKGSNALVTVERDKPYTGDVNKSFTFVALNTGELGQQDIVFQWADTEGHSGKFTVTAADEIVDVFQGVKLKFGLGVSGRFIANESFTVDCQAPTLQKGADSGVAQSEKLVHDGFKDQISPIQESGSAIFTYSYKGIEASVTVTDGMSLNILAEAINASADNPGVTASVINDGTGTSTAYHLILTGAHTGAESTIKILAGDFTNVNFEAKSFSKAREATNAMVKVDGFPSGADNWMQRRTNEVADAIDGVIMTVKAPGTTTLTVSNDAGAMRDKILQFVESVNFCKSYILEYTKWGGSNLVVGTAEDGSVTTSRETKNGIMIGNYGFQISQSSLDKLMTNPIVPFSEDPTLSTKEKIDKRQKYLDDHGLVYSSLSQIGITSDPDNQGLYKVEQSTLLECINADPEAVIRLFTYSDEYVDYKDANNKNVMVYIKGITLDMGEKMAALTSDQDIYDTAGNFVEKAKGILVTLQENYQGIIEDIDAKITREERRIEQVRARLTDKFNRLEVALQQLESQQSALESSIASLSSSSSS